MISRFRWVALQLERLKDCINKEEVKTTLDTLPKTLQETYYRVLNELKSTRRKYVIRVLQFLAYSDTPMDLGAAVDALAINLTAPPGSRFIMKERMPLPAEISSLCSTLFVAVSNTSSHLARDTWYDATMLLQLAHSSVKEFILFCPMTEFDGLLTEPTARLTITKICLVYFLEMNCYLSDEELRSTYHLLPLAVDTWLRDASCRGSRFNTFTHLSMELFSNRLLFKRWRKLIMSRFYDMRPWSIRRLRKHDQLFYASWSGDQNCVKKLIDARATGDTIAWRLDSALHVASEFGHLETVALLIREGADVNAEGEVHNVLSLAVEAGHTDIIALLIKEGADVNAQQGRYGNALEIASASGRLDIVELLIKQGANINSQSSYSNALYSASLCGHLNIVIFLLEHGADVNVQGGYFGSALCAASRSGHLNIVTYLLGKGADVNAQGQCFENALHVAIAFKEDAIVKFLRNYKADLRYVDVSSLHRYNERYCYPRLELVFHGRFNPDTLSTFRKAPLHSLAQERRFTKLAQRLFDHFADPSILDTSSMIRLHFASRGRRSTTKIRYLPEHGPFYLVPLWMISSFSGIKEQVY